MNGRAINSDLVNWHLTSSLILPAAKSSSVGGCLGRAGGRSRSGCPVMRPSRRTEPLCARKLHFISLLSRIHYAVVIQREHAN